MCRASVPLELGTTFSRGGFTRSHPSCMFFKKKVKMHDTSLPAFLTQTLSGPVDDPSKLPKWNFDGSSTGQAPGDDSEVILWYHSCSSSTLKCVPHWSLPCCWRAALIHLHFFFVGMKPSGHLQRPVQEGEEHTGNQQRPSFCRFSACMNVDYGYGESHSFIQILSCL